MKSAEPDDENQDTQRDGGWAYLVGHLPEGHIMYSEFGEPWTREEALLRARQDREDPAQPIFLARVLHGWPYDDGPFDREDLLRHLNEAGQGCELYMTDRGIFGGTDEQLDELVDTLNEVFLEWLFHTDVQIRMTNTVDGWEREGGAKGTSLPENVGLVHDWLNDPERDREYEQYLTDGGTFSFRAWVVEMMDRQSWGPHVVGDSDAPSST